MALHRPMGEKIMMMARGRRALAVLGIAAMTGGGFAGGIMVADHRAPALHARFSVDGQAVASVRQLLDRQGVPGKDHWRSTVVADGEDGWIVRTWISEQVGAARPLGTPDYVHDVTLAPASDGVGVSFHIEQLSLGT